MKKEKEYLTLKEVQTELNEMLKQLIVFFEENKFEYFIWAGTYLGAVRHKGFIPWDDDVDLAMTRPVFNKLINYIKENGNKINENLEFIGYELGNSDFPILKLINKSIEIDEEEKQDKYLWIDIFPLDGTPKNNKKYLKRIARLNAIFYLKRQQNSNQELIASNKIKRILKKILMGILKFWNWESFKKYYYNYCTKYDYEKSEYVKNNIWSDSEEIYKKTDLVFSKYEFNGLKVTGIKDYDKFLSLGYGNDYMELPPIEERITHDFKAWRSKK